MTIYALFILNKSGGLIFHRALTEEGRRQPVNELLRLASMFHSMHIIASSVAPVKSGGMEVLEAETFNLHAFITITSIKFFLITDTTKTSYRNVFNQVYQLYCDHVLKNPFYELEMPIRIDIFTEGVDKALTLT